MAPLSGFLGLFRGKPIHGVGDDGRMAIGDHVRELRARLMRSLAVLLVLFVVALFFSDQLLSLIMGPYNDARTALGESVVSKPVINGAGGPLLAIMKLAGAAALIGSAPVWLYQIWAFVVPGLHHQERKWSLVFIGVAGPLFLLGIATGYYVLPKGLQVLIGFTFKGFENLVNFDDYFSFFIRMLLVFGIALEIPVFAVMLNVVGILPGRTLGHYRPWVAVGSFVFAAVATPSTDPFSMSMLAIPLVLLFLVSEVVMRALDRSRARKAQETAMDIDAASELP